MLDASRARAVALDLLSRKPWTRHELRQRLLRRGAPEGVADTVVADLERGGYLDDRAFAAGWAETRARGRMFGSRRLRAELSQKGVARPLVDEAVRAAFAEVDEETRARAAAKQRVSAARGGVRPGAARRLYAYLLRQGFPSDVATRVVRQVCHLDDADE